MLGLYQSAGDARAITIVGGTTAVSATDLFGLTPKLLGTASLGPTVPGALATVIFPITGGSTDGTNALIEHEGSGLKLKSGSSSVAGKNFLIDTAAATVFGDAKIKAGGTKQKVPDVPLFTFGTGTALPGVELEISPALAGVLTAVFGADDLTGATFGYAVPSPEVAPIPLPAGVFLLVGALGSFALVRRRRAA